MNNEARIELEKLGPVQEYEHRGVRYFIKENGTTRVYAGTETIDFGTSWVCGYLERTPFVEDYIFEEQWPGFSGWTYESENVVGFDSASHPGTTVDMVKKNIIEMIDEACYQEYLDTLETEDSIKVRVEHWRKKDGGQNLCIHKTPHYAFTFNTGQKSIDEALQILDVIFDGERGFLTTDDYSENVPKAFDLVKAYYVTGKKEKDDE